MGLVVLSACFSQPMDVAAMEDASLQQRHTGSLQTLLCRINCSNSNGLCHDELSPCLKPSMGGGAKAEDASDALEEPVNQLQQQLRCRIC